MIRFLATILFVFSMLSVANAKNLPFRHYTSDVGLNSNVIYDVVQDNKGFIWFATSSGIVRYDGKFWKNYTLQDGISDNDILKIKKDLNGRLWLLAFNGTITIIDDNKIYNHHNHPLLKDIGPGFFYKYIYSADKHTIWLSNYRDSIICITDLKYAKKYLPKSSYIFDTEKGGVILEKIKLSDSLLTRYPYLNKDSGKLINHFTYFKDSLFIALCDSNILTIDKKNNYLLTPILLPFYKSISSIFCDSDLSLWIAMEKFGVVHAIKKNNRYEIDEVFLKNDHVNAVYRDNEKNIWFTTHGNGVFMLPHNYREIGIINQHDNINENEAHAIFADQENNIYIGHKYERMSLLKGDQSSVVNLKSNTNRLGRILKIRQHASGVLLISTDEGFYVMQNESKIIPVYFQNRGSKFITNHTIKNFVIADNNDVYVVCQESINIIKSNSLKNESIKGELIPLPERRIYACAIKNEHEFWFSGFDGLMKKNGAHLTYLKDTYPILGNRIMDMCYIKNYLVVAVLGYGIVILKDDKIIYHFTEESRLVSNYCTKVFPINNEIWVCTNKGLNVISVSNNQFSLDKYTLADGLLSNHVNDVYIKNNTLYAATLNGVSALKLKKQNIAQPYNNGIYFTKITWKGKSIIHEKNPTIDYVDKFLRFEYVSPTYEFPEGVTYKYSLNGGNWIETKQTTLEFSSLKPGPYTLAVAAKKLNTTWTQPISYPFMIETPFYQSRFFYLLLFTLLAGSAIVFYLYRINRIKQEQKVTLTYEQKINQLQIQTLQAMMNPHFIFNSLSAIQQQINLGDSYKAGKYLTTFSKLLRKNLETITENFISVEDELEKIKLYLDSEKMRLGDKLNYLIEVDPNINPYEIQIPSMIIQPMIENAIWHGILPFTNQGFVLLRIDKKDDQIEITVEDNGIGIDHAISSKEQKGLKKKHFGIKITKERLLFLEKKLGKKCSIELLDLSEENRQGTKVTIILPWIED